MVFTEVQQEPSDPGGELAKLLASFFYRNHLIETVSASPERVKLLIACALQRAWMIAPLELNITYQMELNYLKNIPLVRYLATGVSRYPGLMCRKTVTGLWDYLRHRRMTRTPGSLSQALYHLDRVKQGLARLESSSLHLRGVDDSLSSEITRPCWTRLTTLMMNFLCLSLLLRLRHHDITPNTFPFDVRRRMDRKQ